VLGRLAYNISNGLTAGVNLSYDQAFETRFSADLKYRFGGNGNKNESEKKALQAPVMQALIDNVKHRDVRVHDYIPASDCGWTYTYKGCEKYKRDHCISDRQKADDFCRDYR
jgi:hypothetical protein